MLACSVRHVHGNDADLSPLVHLGHRRGHVPNMVQFVVSKFVARSTRPSFDALILVFLCSAGRSAQEGGAISSALGGN